MRKPFSYWLKDDTLVVEGKFFGVSTGIMGGWRRVDCAFNHTVKEFIEDEDSYVRKIARRLGLRRYFPMLTAVPVENFALKQRSEVAVFATAGVSNPNERIGTINVIAVIDARLTRAAMLNAIITITEAKSHALISCGYDFTGTSSDAVVILSTGRGEKHKYAGYASEIGRKLWEASKSAIVVALAKTEGRKI
ncbi:MAG: adenosylcobinamide amidohydrolase [Archaeoglobaceae archaeon]